MNYRAMAEAIRNERVELLRSYAEAGYRLAWSKLVYMAIGMDLPFDELAEYERVGDLVEQALNNPYKAD